MYLCLDLMLALTTILLSSPLYAENEEFERNIEFSSSMDFDPAYPQVLLLMVKWYWKTEHLGEHLKELYPNNTEDSAILMAVCVCVCVCVSQLCQY